MEEYRDLLLSVWEDGGASGSAVIGLEGWSIGICCYLVGRKEEYRDLLLFGW